MRNIEKKDIVIKSNCDNLAISVTMFVPEGEKKEYFKYHMEWQNIKKDIMNF